MNPVLFAGFKDLTKIRYDYPLVLLNENFAGDCLKSLTEICDEILREIAPPGTEGEAMRLQLLRLEQEIRQQLAAGESGQLSAIWDNAATILLNNSISTGHSILEETLGKARAVLNYDGELVDCDAHLPARLITRIWKASQYDKVEQLKRRARLLAKSLADILHVNEMHMQQARGEKQLRGSIGTADIGAFDFKSMSKILKSAPVGDLLPASRQQRLRDAIDILQNQRFISVDDENTPAKQLFSYVFNSCGKARAAYKKRLPDMAALVRAIGIAELEIANRYDEDIHNAYFEHFDEKSLGPEDLEMFPSYLVCINDLLSVRNSHAEILETLCSGLPFKIMAQSPALFEQQAIPDEQISSGINGRQLASMALGLSGVSVVQCASSSLYPLRNNIQECLAGDLPVLISVYSGGSTTSYLHSAAATESRVFPSFVFNPDLADGLAGRFSLAGNPQPDKDWPIHKFQYENAEHDGITEELAFTPVEFLGCLQNQATHFVPVSLEDWNDEMIPVADFLDLDELTGLEKLPYTLLLDDSNNVRRAIIDKRLIEASRQCLSAWHDLQELGGINNSHVAAALAKAEAGWLEEKEQLLQEAAKTPPAVASPDPDTEISAESPAPAAETAAAEPAPIASDEAWIETPRCTTCNECTELNNRMFAYNDDMQAYIADLSAGSFRELVEAAETCQVAIIHPGKPQDPGEPGIEELIARAEPFM
jgi:ferredoxin